MKLCRKNGFTLIELVMTIVVVGIIAISLSLALSQHVRGVWSSEEYDGALNAARLEMEKVNNFLYANVVSASGTTGGYNWNRIVSYIRGSDITAESVKRIVLIVNSPGGPVLITLITYLAKNISYPY